MSTIKSQHRRECGIPTTVKRDEKVVTVWRYTLPLKEWVRAVLRGSRAFGQATRDGLPAVVDWAIRKGVRA